MNTQESEFGQLLDRLRDGDQAAAEELFQTFGRPLQRVLSRRLPAVMRSRVGASDLAQAVWCSFFRNIEDITAFESPESLQAFLLTMARNKLFDETRRQLGTQRRDKSLEKHIHSETTDSLLKARSATASQLVQRDDVMVKLLKDLSERDREICRHRLDGATVPEIAAEFGLHERTVRRIFEKLEKRFSE